MDPVGASAEDCSRESPAGTGPSRAISANSHDDHDSTGGNGPIAEIEAAMVAIRRSQSRRVLARRAAAGGVETDIAIHEIVDAVEAAEEADGAATVSSIAAALDMAQPRASKLVATAVAAGFLERRADQADGRRAMLVRTDAGRELSARVHRFRREQFVAAMSGWTDADKAAFARLLRRFVSGMP
jgi:DNA-binding MarR family transcriptional regulator